MPRAKNLDNIAPDDNYSQNSDSQPKKKKTVKSKPLEKTKQDTSKSQANKNEYRSRVYELIKGTTRSSFSSFLARPKVFTFDTRQQGEEIILVLRRHWLTNLPWIFITIIMALAPVLLSFVPLLDFFPLNFRFVFILFWYLITFAIGFEKFLSWYFNVFILTEERVIDIDFYNLLDKKFSEAKLSMIQDVTAQIEGVPQTIFGYGTVLIQTAAEIPVITIEKIPNPNLVLKILQEMRGEEELEALEGRLK